MPKNIDIKFRRQMFLQSFHLYYIVSYKNDSIHKRLEQQSFH